MDSHSTAESVKTCCLCDAVVGIFVVSRWSTHLMLRKEKPWKWLAVSVTACFTWCIIVGICCCVVVIYTFDVETGKTLITISCVCYSVLHVWCYCGYLLLCCSLCYSMLHVWCYCGYLLLCCSLCYSVLHVWCYCGYLLLCCSLCYSVLHVWCYCGCLLLCCSDLHFWCSDRQGNGGWKTHHTQSEYFTFCYLFFFSSFFLFFFLFFFWGPLWMTLWFACSSGFLCPVAHLVFSDTPAVELQSRQLLRNTHKVCQPKFCVKFSLLPEATQ